MTHETKVKVVTADPSALGLFGLAIITLVASSQKLGLTSGVSLVLPWAIFLGLSLSSFGIIEPSAHMLAAYAELLIAILSFYGSSAAVLNTHFGRTFLPVGKPFGIFKK